MSQHSFRPAKKTSLSEDICQQLLNSIISGELTPGSKLPSEHELMELFSVGRSTIREALRALTVLGLIETKQGYGACVASRSGSYLGSSITWQSLASLHTNLEIIEAREVVEVGVVQLVAERATADDIAQLELLLRDMEVNVSDMLAFAELDVSFHTTLAEIAGNRLLSQFILSLRGLLHQNIMEDLRKSTSMAQLSLDQHREIVEAIKTGDPRRAVEALSYHLKDVSGRLLSQVANGKSSNEPQKAGR